MSDLDRLTQARNIVRNLPSWYAELAAALEPSGGGGYRERVSTSKVEAPLVVSETVVDLRADIVRTLYAWADRVADAASFERIHSKAPARTAEFIINGWRWVEVDPEVDKMVDAVVDLSDRIDNVVAPPERHPVADRIHDGLIDGQDVATVLGVAKSTVRAWVASGELTVAEVQTGRVGRPRNLYAIDDIRALKLKRDIARGDIEIDAEVAA